MVFFMATIRWWPIFPEWDIYQPLMCLVNPWKSWKLPQYATRCHNMPQEWWAQSVQQQARACSKSPAYMVHFHNLMQELFYQQRLAKNCHCELRQSAEGAAKATVTNSSFELVRVLSVRNWDAAKCWQLLDDTCMSQQPIPAIKWTGLKTVGPKISKFTYIIILFIYNYIYIYA